MNNYLLLTDIGLTLQYRNARVGQECKNKPDWFPGHMLYKPDISF